MPAKRIAVWFFKGGVGKTTMAVNVAAELALQGKRVALLDFDGQCNVTSMLIVPPAYASDELDNSDDVEEVEPVEGLVNDEEAEVAIFHDNPKAVEPDWIQDYNQRLVPNAYTALSPYIAGNNTAPNLELKEVQGYGGRFWVLPGSSQLFEHDSLLAGGNLRHLNSINPLGGFNQYCKLLEENYKLDFIVVDLSPGASALARTVIMSCDYLLPPLAADFFSLTSAQAMLCNVIPRWLQWHDELINCQVELRAGQDDATADHLLWFRSEPVQILPFLITGYNIRGKRGEINFVAIPHCPPLSIVTADSKWVHAITNLLSDASDTPLKDKVRQRMVSSTGRDGVVRYAIPFLKDIGAICQFSQMMNTPIPTLDMAEVRAAGIEVGGTRIYQNHCDQLNHAKRKYASLGRFLIDLCGLQQ